MDITENTKICIIGLGYVGLPLAISLSKHFNVTGFDINSQRVSLLKDGLDPTNEVESSVLSHTNMIFSDKETCLSEQDIYIITVPTPVTSTNTPDLGPLELSAKMLSNYLSSGSIVILESTVYPGVTEEVLGSLLEKHSGLISGKDFFLGYSPERMNPGDKTHTVEKITKVISGQTPQVLDILNQVYGCLNKNNIHKAPSIKVAEAAKVIENTQRDINIAFINEISMIFNKMGISTYDVLEAARTKWNFLDFKPGLVGGHCIGVDPYYLAHVAKQYHHEPDVILAGRKTNEEMSRFIAYEIDEHLCHKNPDTKTARILILGLTFKENVPDLRNTKVIDLIYHLKKLKHQVDVHDPCASAEEAKAFFNIDLKNSLSAIGDYDCIIGCVSHSEYLDLNEDDFKKLLTPSGFIFDLKSIWHGSSFCDSEILHYKL